MTDIEKYILENFEYKDGRILRHDRKGGLGFIDKGGYLIIKVKSKRYYAHRIVWLLNYGSFPCGELDHINRNKLDNRIENLRISNRLQQNRNKSLAPNKNTGVVGIYIDKTPGLTKKYAFHILGKTYRYKTLEQAILAKNKLWKETENEYYRKINFNSI